MKVWLYQSGIIRLFCACAAVLFVVATAAAWAQQTSGLQQKPVTRYLLFQIFTHDGKSGPAAFPPQTAIESTVKDITARIGAKGDRKK